MGNWGWFYIAGGKGRTREVAEDKSGGEGHGQREGLLTLTDEAFFG